MNVAVLGIRVPTPDLDSGSFRMQRILRVMVECGYRVWFVPCAPFHTEPYGSRLQADEHRLREEGIAVTHLQTDHGQLPSGLPDDLSLVVLSDEWVASRYMGQVRDRFPKARCVFDTVDLHHIRLYREALETRNRKLVALAVGSRRRELEAVREADITLVVSAEEARILEQSLPAADIRVLSNIHSVTDRTTPSFEDRNGLLFVGSFDHSPNVDAVRVLTTEIFPACIPGLDNPELTIVGANPPSFITELALPGLRIAGHVPDLAPYYDRARLSLAPLRFGAGVKGKVLDSMANGLPVVGTPVAAEGTGVRHNVHMVIAEPGESHVSAILELHRDANRWDQIRDAGLTLVRENFSVEAARRVVQSLV